MGRSTSPANLWPLITPHDTNDIPGGPPASLVCDGAGSVVLVDQAGNEMTRQFVAEVIYPYQPLKIKATGTTATGIRGLYN